jgi:hypothetical protein
MKIDKFVDERFLMHRFKATRLATLVGVVLVFVLFTYHIVVDKTIHWELFAIVAAMALTKLAAMFYYRRTN